MQRVKAWFFSPGCIVVAGLLAGALSGCGSVSDKASGLHLAMTADSSTDVARMRFTVDRIACGNEAITPLSQTIDRDLETGNLPPSVPDSGIDPASQHRFADWFVSLVPGCYRVSIQPLASTGQVSTQCAPMSRAPVRVERGRTTEVTLVSQCQSQGRGAIDVVALLNHAPTVNDLQFTTSKFVSQCQDEEVCVTVNDVDRDPLEIAWRKVSGGMLLSGPTVTRRTGNADGSVTECIRVVAEDVGRYELEVSVYDLLRDVNGTLIRFDQYFAQAGAPYTSHDVLVFPFYTTEDGITGGCLASCLDLHNRQPSAISGVYIIDPDGAAGAGSPFKVYCDMATDGGGWTLVANFPWLGSTSGVPGWSSGNAVGTSFIDVSRPFKLADATINQLKTVAYRAHGTATNCLQGPCNVDTTLYWAASCRYNSGGLNPTCGNAYYDPALTQRSTASDSTACAWHWGLVSSICTRTSEMGTSHAGDHNFVGKLDNTFVHAYDGRTGENPSLQTWVK